MQKLYNEADILDIANAIREKNGTNNKYKVSQMGDAIRAMVVIPPQPSDIPNDEPLGKSLKLNDALSGIDTGLTMDASYKFEVKGYAPSENMCILLGAENNTSARTYLAFLPKSQKLQVKWARNTEITAETLGGVIGGSKVAYIQDKNHIEVNLAYSGGEINGVSIETAGNYTASRDDTPIYLLNCKNRQSNGYGGGVEEAKIYDSSDTLLRHFVAWGKDNRYCFKDMVSGEYYYPLNGELEVAE